MKLKLSYLFLVLTIFLSCDELDKLTEFDVSDNYGTTLNVAVPEGGSMSWSENITVNLASNNQVQENLEYIQDVTITNLSFEIDNYVGAADGKLSNATISIAGNTISIGSIDLKAADDSNQIFSIGTAEQLALIAAYLKNEQRVTATLSGTLNTTPVNFDVNIDVEVTVTIDVI
ncbi:hypothetical protein [Aestuariibaculum sediminum]|uniref:Uncharacterized protein n=1 Tax=Aestuariibaculum sediminum TaxID=2770637 RepID=A0A8J6Q9F9_9FLAO|nr:hypothetical protein [Aestuariibaculum sediminum]MBD0832452.1 hypothetical protein [Aestuariibaculum sediminum]